MVLEETRSTTVHAAMFSLLWGIILARGGLHLGRLKRNISVTCPYFPRAAAMHLGAEERANATGKYKSAGCFFKELHSLGRSKTCPLENNV